MKFHNKNVKFLILFFLIIIIFAVYVIWQSGNSFDEELLVTDNIYNHIEELSSEKYFGKATGSTGNELALDYIQTYFEEIGVKPAGVDNTYYQPFKTIVPDIDTNPIFTISDSNNSILKEFIMYEDYNAISSYNGGSIEFFGEMILVDSNILRIDPLLIKDRIVIIKANYLTTEKIAYVTQNGGKGIFICADFVSYGGQRKEEIKKSLSAAGKTGESILVGYISKDMYTYVEDYIGEDIVVKGDLPLGYVKNVTIKVNMDFPITNTANILGMIEGKSKNGRTLLITANIDGAGEGTDNKYFPGAISNSSGVATMLEVARIISMQKNLPYQTIIFIGFNGQMQQLAGSSFYLNNPLYPLDKTSIIHLKNLGGKTLDGLLISSDDINGAITRSKISNYAKDAVLHIEASGSIYSTVSAFNDQRIASVLLVDNPYMSNSYYDTINEVDKDTLKNASLVLLNYIKRDIYNDTKIDYLNTLDYILLIMILLGFLINFTINRFNKTNPNMIIKKRTIEDIYYLTPVTILRKCYLYIIPFFITVFLLGFLANIIPNATISVINNEVSSNFSFYLTVKKSIVLIKSIFTPSPGTAGEILRVVYTSSFQSLKLILSALLLSTTVGIARGLYEGYKSKKRNLKSLGTLIIFSIPDVMIVLIGLMIYIYIAQNIPVLKNMLPLKEFIIPLITLSILPTIYITRIAFITVQDEIKKDYVKNAKAKGVSRKKIFTKELLPAIIFKIVDTLPTIMTMLLSNMIIVEYLFNYRGIVYYLRYFYSLQNTEIFVALAITLGAIYLIFTWGIQLIAKLINPLKREVSNEKS